MQVCDPLGVTLGSVPHRKGGRSSKGVLPARRARLGGRGLGGTVASKAEKLSVLG